MTAVEWFANQLGITSGTMLEQAKEMEKAATISKKEMVEISDEEIIKAAFEHCVEIYQKVSDYENYDTYNDFIVGALWYRKQLRQWK